MDAMSYINAALRTEAPSDQRLLHAAMGMCTETGELMDALKKHMFYGKPLDGVNLSEELGDLFWYIAIACDALGTTFEEVWEMNIAKLRKRYPGKFTEHERDLLAERKELEHRYRPGPPPGAF
jgi:NTP pyrophosphatase (non-canonical NTP hydrolase)